MSLGTTTRYEAGIPAIYLLLLCDVAESFGLSAADITPFLGLSREQLLEPERLLPITQARAATTFVYTQLGHKGLGFAYARALRVTLHGPVSLIALSSKNLREVITALERYFSLRAPAFQLHAEIGDDYVTIRIEYPGKNDPLRPFLMESLLIGLVVMAAQILDQTSAGAEIHMQGAAPSYYAALAPHLPVPVRYEQPEYAILVPRFLMEKPLRLSDPTAASMAREACERQLQARQNSHDDMLTTRVRSVLTASQDQLPTLEEVATALHVSTRTLKRRLQEEGRNFRALVDHVLLERATQMFTEEGLSVSEVAFRLGYTDVSNFSRAFRRWTGVSPSDFRKEH